jgi:hydrogenase nickel incorporation protein HypA/HybF
MHELSITESLLQVALAAAEKHGAKKITRIRIVVGELSQVAPLSVQFYLDILGKGTVAEGAQLETTHVPLRAACEACGEQFAVAAYRFACPKCGAGDTTLVSGREMYLDSIEVE